MSEWIEIVLNPLMFLFFISAGLILWFYILYYTKKKTTDRKELTDKMIFIALGIFFGISVVLLLIDHLLPVSVTDQKGDVSNWATLVIEIGIGIAIGVTIFLYSDFKQKQSEDDISNVKDISKKLDGMVTDVKKTNDDQSNMLKRMEPIIEKQGEEIKRLEEEAKIHRDNIIDSIRTFLIWSKVSLEEIIKADKEKDINLRIGTIKELVRGINDYLERMEKIIEDNRKILLPKEHLEIDMALAGIRITRNACESINIRNYQDFKFLDLDKHIHTIEQVLEFLPDPRPIA